MVGSQTPQNSKDDYREGIELDRNYTKQLQKMMIGIYEIKKNMTSCFQW